jgi:hypothetical protein
LDFLLSAIAKINVCFVLLVADRVRAFKLGRARAFDQGLIACAAKLFLGRIGINSPIHNYVRAIGAVNSVLINSFCVHKTSLLVREVNDAGGDLRQEIDIVAAGSCGKGDRSETLDHGGV